MLKKIFDYPLFAVMDKIDITMVIIQDLVYIMLSVTTTSH